MEEFFKRNPKVAVAFSGGVDSAYLLYVAQKYAKDVCAYYVKTQFQPKFELEDAVRLSKQLGAKLNILSLNILTVPNVCENPPERCYYCKKAIFGAIMEAAAADGYTVLLDGTNASDDVQERPGMRALRELSVLSPLRECGLTKTQIRALSKEANLFTWDKPAYACLATRIPTGETITGKKLCDTEKAEEYLFSLGFTDFRVRSQDGHARLQMPEKQLERLLKYRKDILVKLKEYYKTVSLDLEVRS